MTAPSRLLAAASFIAGGVVALAARSLAVRLWHRWRSLALVDEVTSHVGKRPYMKMPCVSPESHARAEAFVPRPTDVIIVTYAKTGTTMLQHVCHQLRTGGGHLGFEEITEVVPWLDFCLDVGTTPEAEQLTSPRLFKTHQRLAAINRLAKYLCTIRDPVKYYAFYCEKGWADKPIDDFCFAWARNELWMPDNAPRTSLWDCLIDVWNCRHLPSVCVLVFEDIVADLPAHLPRIAAFLGVRCDDALVQRVAHRASKEWMAAHAAQFDDHWLSQRQAASGRAPRVVPPSAKVVAGAHAHRLSAAAREALRERWSSQVAPHTGCATYKEMAEALRAGARA